MLEVELIQSIVALVGVVMVMWYIRPWVKDICTDHQLMNSTRMDALLAVSVACIAQKFLF